ncbi:MAG: DUF962 domain-containing protein [Planctomycetes bacterium]|nr:DUF962 domain-containing protein [Planctomycetota bacterium]
MSDTSQASSRPAWLRNWLPPPEPGVILVHMAGIPMTIAAIPLAIWQLSRDEWSLWWRPAALFIGGYLLQWIGHVIEGNDMGEIILVKKKLGKPYVAVSARYAKPGSSAGSAS